MGPPHIRVGGRPLEVDTRKAVALLALLAVDGTQTRDRLAALLWPDADDRHARGALRRTLSVLRTAVGADRLTSDRGAVALEPRKLEVDVHRFRSLLDDCAGHDHPPTSVCSACVDPLSEAVALHRGELLGGFALRGGSGFDDWREIEAEQLRRAVVGAYARLTRAEIETGDHDSAPRHLLEWLAVDPLNEHVHGRLMLLHAWQGERGEAIARYRECVQLLHRELGVAPLTRTTALYRSILEGTVEPPQGVPRRSGGPAAHGTTVGGGPGPGPQDAAARVEPLADPLVGRDDELEAALAALLDDRPRIVRIVGEPGIGKTRLLDELEAALRRRGVPVARMRCWRAETQLAYAPVVGLLRALDPGPGERVTALPDDVLVEAGRLVPGLAPVGTAAPGPPSLDVPGARTRFLEGLARVLDATAGPPGRPRVLAVDDADAADDPTLELLGYLVRHLLPAGLRLVVTRRSGPVGTRTRMGGLPGSGDDVVAIELPRLTRTEVEQLLRASSGRQEIGELAARIHAESEGVPLIVVGYLRMLDDTAAPPDGAWAMPAGVRDLVRSQLACLSGQARQIVTAGAVIGSGFDPATVAQVAGRTEEETVGALEELQAWGLVRSGEEGYELSHDRIRSVAYQDTSPVRRRLLHGRVADALAADSRRADRGEPAARIAEHARLAGRHAEAAAWEMTAGDRARRLFAYLDAVTHYERALALGHEDPAEVHRRIARLLVLDGDHGGALQRYELAAATARDDASRGVIDHEIGGLHLRRGHWDLARIHLGEAGRSLAHERTPAAARVVADCGLLELRRGRLRDAAPLSARALQIAERCGDQLAIAQARNLAGLLAHRRGDPVAARRHLEHAPAVAARLEDPTTHIAALNNLALVTAEAGELDRARELLGAAVASCHRLGDRHRLAALQHNLADLERRGGDGHAAVATPGRAAGPSAPLGGVCAPGTDEEEIDEDGTDEAGVWRLVEW